MRHFGFNMDYMVLLLLILAIGCTYGRFTVCHFENSFGCAEEFPAEESSLEGWRINKNAENSYVFASCQSNCVQQMTLMNGYQSMQLSKWTVDFCYFLSTIEGAVDIRTVKLQVLACGKNISVPVTEGAWKTGTIRFNCMEQFSVGFEIHFGGAFQRIALDQISVRDEYTKPTEPQCATTAPSLFDLYPAIIQTPITPAASADYQENAAAGETAVFGEENEPATESIPPVFTDETYLAGNVSVQVPKKPFASGSEKTTPANGNSGQTVLNSMLSFFEDLLANPLLLAEVLAIATVAICCMTITIHCFIWRKQRRTYRLDLEKSIRAQRYLAKDLSNSDMLLNMTVHEGNDGDFGPISRSRSSSKATPPVDRAKLKATKHATDRRATVCKTVTSAPDSDEEAKPRPHPRTKSLPSRPAVNYYETIDEVRKNALQPVQEGECDESRSRSLPSLVDDLPAPPKTKRSARSCKDKNHRRSKKQKKRSRKETQSNVEATDIKMTHLKGSACTEDNTYENSGATVPKTNGHFYDKLGRESHSYPDQVCDVRVVNAIKKRSERLSLNVDNRKNSPKINKFRQRSLSQKIAEKEEWSPLGPTLSDQNTKLKGGVSKELNNKLDNEERPYFTLEPIGFQEGLSNEISSSELSDDMISGSLDTLQEQYIISKNHTDSFKRSISIEQKANRPDLTTMDSEAYETYEIGAQCHVGKGNKAETDSLKLVDDKPVDKNDDFTDRTYQTLEPPPDFDGDVNKNRSSEETFF